MRWPLASLLGASVLLASSAAASPAAPAALSRRAPVPAGGDVDFYNPLNRTGGHMLSILPDSDLGEPINVIISGRSSKSVLSVEGFLLWATSVHFGVSCLGQANGTQQLANLGDGQGNQTQGSGDGNNGVMRWNYYDPYIGTCKETLIGGNHFRWWQQIGPDANSGAYFLAVSNEANLARHHEIVVNGYNTGRDELVGNATFPNGTTWEGNYYQATVEWIEAGVLLNDSSFGINHAPRVNPPGGEAQDGRVALLTVIQTVVSPQAT
ncbi:hypothetical protein FA09DRAFT_294386 [Tilletiopsis washingtonensis]|uniref:Uncharacterized protein n=1 Tax=Tilletiopsis washingtonensis TaxID=58919 RepID=A0A316ZFT9_9BASI|nr:hypothetical protein FA09DRAFT_294386 [Tilletiopsis washingtonensis]PWO00107.1 hypothetical protein FA09DRAFT_294386 [Tilletiopsis washingtonensis]